MRKLLLTFFLFILSINSAYAEEKISIFGENCSPVSKSEPIAKSRLRAQDQALFYAISKLPVLEIPKNEFDQYSFNSLVYNLADNYTQDLTTKTSKQTENNICISISGYLIGENIISAIIEAKATADNRKNNYSSKDEIEEQFSEPLKKEVKLENPITTYKNIEDELTASPEDFSNYEVDGNDSHIIVEDADTIIIEKEFIEEKETEKNINDKALIYINDTKFFNDQTSKEHSKVLEDNIKNNKYLEITDNKEIADYIITPNILRVKVDIINEKTNRMQIVIMLEMEDIKDEIKATEHQNRFTIFTNEDDEQEIAKDLMEKLLIKANHQIMSKISNKERKNKNLILPDIITPN